MRELKISQNSWIALAVIAIIAAMGFIVAQQTLGFSLLAATTSTATTASPSGLEFYTGNGLDELSIVRGGSEDQVLKWGSDGQIGWGEDATASVTGSGTVIFDADDDGANESVAITEIATTGDTNNVFSESGDKVTITVSNNWPTADLAATATALAANGANCIAGEFNKGVDASGAAETCAALLDSDVPNDITIDLATTATALAANPSDCAANEFATDIAANGDLTCDAIDDSDVPNTITISLAATATALAADPADCTSDTKADAIAASGALTCSKVDSGDITDGTIQEQDMKLVDSPADEECLTYEATGGDFEWQACSGGSQNLFETINASSGTNPVADSTTDTLNVSGGVGVTVTGDSGTDTITLAFDPTAVVGTNCVLVAASDAASIVQAGAYAVADGTADDVEIQDALDNFDCVQLAGKTFTLSDTILLNNGNVLRGTSRTTYTPETTDVGTRLVLANSLVDKAVVSVTGTEVRWFAMQDLWLDGNGSNQSGSTADVVNIDFTGSSVVNARRLLFKNLTIYNGQDDGLVIDIPAGQGGGCGEYFDVILKDNGGDGGVFNCPDVNAFGMKSHGNGGDGITLGGNSGNAQFIGGFSKNNTGNGLTVSGGGNRSMFNTFTMQDNDQHGAYIDRGDIAFIGGIFDSNGQGTSNTYNNLTLTSGADRFASTGSIFVDRQGTPTIKNQVEIQSGAVNAQILGGQFDGNAVTAEISDSGTNTILAHISNVSDVLNNRHVDHPVMPTADCNGTLQATTYVTSSNTFGCLTITGIGSSELTDNDILEEDLKVVDSPSDEECLTYEATGGDFEWQSCSSSLPSLADDNAWVGNGSSIATATSIPDCDATNRYRLQYDTTTNAITCDTDTFTSNDIADNTIQEADIKAVDSAVDEECLTYESTGGDFEWQTCGGAGANSFETWDAPIGTDPVASSSSDTMTLDSPQSTIAITGSSSTDTLSFDVLKAPQLSSNPADCGSNTFATAIDSFGNLACASIADADVPNSITIDLAATATALASNPTDCGANAFAISIVASGNLTCASIVDADVPDSITITLAATATALAANPTDCGANEFATDIAANGDLTCAAIADADVPDDITIDLASTATALASNPTDCGANTKADAIAANGNLTCSAVDTGDVTDNDLLEEDLKVVDSPSDEECLTYEATGGDFEWQSCGSSQNLFETHNALTGTDPVADSPTDTLNWTSTGSTLTIVGDSSTDTINLEVVSAPVLSSNPADCSANTFATTIAANGDLTCASITDADVPNSITITLAATATALAADPADCSANAKADAIAANGDLTCSAVDTGDITDNDILEEDLKVVDSPSDEECLTYEATGGDFEWETCASAQNLFETFNASSGTDPVADDPNDTLNVTGGTGITVTGDSSSDTLTIATTVTDTSADTICAGTTTYLDGEGNCDTLDGAEDFETATDDGLLVGNGTTFDTVVLTDCNSSNIDRLQYDVTTNVFSCDTDTFGDADVDDNITIDLAATATALAANPSDCAADTKADAIAANGDLTCSAVDTGDITDNTVNFGDLNYSNTLAGNPALAEDECFFAVDASLGGGFLCEGFTADGNEQFYYLPNVNGADTTNAIITTNANGLVTGTMITNGSVDISTDTNHTCGRSLTTSGDGCDADAELYTENHTLWFEDPTASDDFQSIWVAITNTYTITAISCESDQTVNFDLQVDDGTPAGVNGSDIACTTFATDSSLAGDTTLAAGERLDLAITSVSGTPTWVSITWTVTVND